MLSSRNYAGYVKNLGETANLSMQLSNTATKGFHIRIMGRKGIPGERRNDGDDQQALGRLVQLDTLPDEFIRAKKMGTQWSCTTAELVHLAQKAKHAVQTAQALAAR